MVQLEPDLFFMQLQAESSMTSSSFLCVDSPEVVVAPKLPSVFYCSPLDLSRLIFDVFIWRFIGLESLYPTLYKHQVEWFPWACSSPRVLQTIEIRVNCTMLKERFFWGVQSSTV